MTPTGPGVQRGRNPRSRIRPQLFPLLITLFTAHYLAVTTGMLGAEAATTTTTANQESNELRTFPDVLEKQKDHKTPPGPGDLAQPTSKDVANKVPNSAAEFFVRQANAALLVLAEHKKVVVELLLSWINGVVKTLLVTLGFHPPVLTPTETPESQKPPPPGESNLNADAPIDCRDEEQLVVPFLGRKIRYEDLYFVERFVLDTVDVVKAWKRKQRMEEEEEHHEL